jgi:peroxiredoxin
MLIDAWRGVSSMGWWWRACAVCLVIVAGGCSKSDPGTDAAAKPKFEVADEGTNRNVASPDLPPARATDGVQTGKADTAPGGALMPDGAPQQPPSIPGEQLDTITVPSGTPEELLAFINQMGERVDGLQRQIQSGNANPTAMQPMFEAMLEASDKLLAADIDPEKRKLAINYKVFALTVLSQLAPAQPRAEQLREFANSLAADKDPSVSIEGRAILLRLLVGEISQKRSQDVDGLLAQLKSVLADEARNDSVLSTTQQAVIALRALGRDTEAFEVFKLIADAFKDHPNPELAAEADNMQEQLILLDLKLDTKLNEVVLKREGADAAFVDSLKQLLQRPKSGAVALEKVLNCVPVLEQSGSYALANQVCELVQAAYKDSPNADLRQYAQQRTDLVVRRLNLLGKPLSVEGTLLGGAPLDFAPYQGKVVLLAFWSSLSPPCRPELLAVKSVYEKYHAKGFEVIGVCLDQDAAATSRFLDETKLPWVTIVNNKLAEQFGVEVIPYMVLTDAQGNIADLFVRGSALEAKLAAMLGEPVPTSPPAPTTNNPSGS